MLGASCCCVAPNSDGTVVTLPRPCLSKLASLDQRHHNTRDLDQAEKAQFPPTRHSQTKIDPKNCHYRFEVIILEVSGTFPEYCNMEPNEIQQRPCPWSSRVRRSPRRAPRRRPLQRPRSSGAGRPLHVRWRRLRHPARGKHTYIYIYIIIEDPNHGPLEYEI